jgi:hypothetical protein
MEPDERPFAAGRLVRLPFEEWETLDSEFELGDAKYRKSDPVFYVSALDDGLGPDRAALTTAAHRVLWNVHTAFLLERSAPLLPAPTLSCLYFTRPQDVHDFGGAPLQVIGPLEREFIVYGSPLPHMFESDSLDDVEALCRYIETTAVQDVRGTVRAAIDLLEETARPDSWYGGDPIVCRAHAFVRCMAAAERLLLPPEHDFEKGEITKTFGRHAGALLGAPFDDRDGTSEHAAGLHRLRGELLHGRKMPDAHDQELLERFAEGRRLLAGAVYSALTLRPHVSDAAPLWRWLAACWEHPEQQQKLIAALNASSAAS